MYIYPDNLAAKATLWLWELKDLAIIGIGFLIGIFSLVRTGALLPLALVVAVIISAMSFSYSLCILDAAFYPTIYMSSALAQGTGFNIFFDKKAPDTNLVSGAKTVCQQL